MLVPQRDAVKARDQGVNVYPNRKELAHVLRRPNPRIELCCSSPSCNPYLAFAVMLKAGLDGINNDLPLPAATEESLFEPE